MTFRKSSLWTTAAEKKLCRLYKTDMTVKAIAEALGGGFTVGAVVSRARHLSLPFKARRKRTATKAAPEKRQRAVKKTFTKNGPLKDAVYRHSNYSDGFKARFEGQGVSLLKARDNQCRWPFEGIGADGYSKCCGEGVVEGTSYCERHCRAAYHVMPKRQPAAEVAP